MRRQTIPEKIKKEVAYRAWKYGIPEARKWGDKKYPEYKFKRETVRDWKFKYEKYCKENYLAVSANSSQSLFTMPRGKPALISEELSSEIKQILSNLRVAGCSISRKVVISVGNGVLATRCPEKMSRNGGKISLTVKWARDILKLMNWVKRRGATAKRTMNPALYDVLAFTWKKKIAEKVFEHKIHNDLILNFDQTPIGFTCPAITTFTEKNAEIVPIGNLDDKRQITGTFVVNLSGEFFPIQLIYTGKTDLCHPKVKFPNVFDINHSPNHWANKEIVMSLLKKIVFPFVNKKRETLSLSKDAKALLIFDVFKGQATPAVNDLLKDNRCIVQHVPNNHNTLFHPLDFSVNKSAKSFISDKYQEWYASEVTSQLGKGIDPYNVKVDVKLTTLKAIHARWIKGFYKHMQTSGSNVKAGFRKAIISEAVKEAEALINLCENPFQEIEIA